ncbi:zinc finger protein DZIP1L isoform B [Alligator mississippiensis]|uniref:Zinc finger protein DZIP1L isoform B n=1 Tax=Alligator mississippiensis TaxID=8496 RepID=A0A151NGW0_ALLMI|nr:zinc finger protein DZIP1L isoform B [Alligator mississippiensis]
MVFVVSKRIHGKARMLRKIQILLGVFFVFAFGILYEFSRHPGCLFSCMPIAKKLPTFKGVISQGNSIIFLETTDRLEPSPLVSCSVESAARIYHDRPIVFFMKGLKSNIRWDPKNTSTAFSLLSALKNVFIVPLQMETLLQKTPLLSWYHKVNETQEKNWVHVSSDASRLAIIWKYAVFTLSHTAQSPAVAQRETNAISQPFSQNIYYPWYSPAFRTQWPSIPGHGTPMSYPSNGAVFGNMLTSPGGIPAFKFQSRRDSIDWRRFSAIDVERVARELDMTTLQESINSVTFCNLDSEKCPYCQQPVDPVLLKVFKMAQLTIEYLLHSQEYLSASLALQEEQLQSAMEKIKLTKQEVEKQAEEMRGVKEESRRRKKMIATQQLLLQAGANNYHKCHLCDKAFMNYSFLQAHVQRRHVEASEAERQKKKQVEQMEEEIEELKVRLKETRAQLEAEREVENQRRAQEAEKVHQREEEGKREFERWKEEERTKFQKEMDGLRQLFLTEFKDIASKNSALEGKLQELQAKNLVVSNLGTLRDEDTDGKRQRAMTQREFQGMREKIDLQKAEWKRKLKELQQEHQVEKEELKIENERLQASLSQDQRLATSHFQQQKDLLSARLKEQARIIQAQEKTIKMLSARKVEVTQEVTNVEAQEESSEEELEDTLDRKQRLLEALRRNPNLLKQFRPILEDMLEEKLESMGVRRAAKGIPAQTYKTLRDLVRTQQQQKAKKFPHLLSLREKLIQDVTWKVKQQQKEDDTLLQQVSVISVKSPKSPVSPHQVTSSKPKMLPAELQANISETPNLTPCGKVTYPPSSTETPKITPRNKARGPTSPRCATILQASTPPFSSEEESVGDHSNLPPMKVRHPMNMQQVQTPSRMTHHDASESDWSDIESSEEKASPVMVLSAGTTPSGTRVAAIAKNLESTLNMTARKPAGGVKLLPAQSTDSPKASHLAKKLQFVDEDSDLEISSFEEITEHLDAMSQTKMPQQLPPQAAVRRSVDSAGSQATSVWSSSSTKTRGW